MPPPFLSEVLDAVYELPTSGDRASHVVLAVLPLLRHGGLSGQCAASSAWLQWSFRQGVNGLVCLPSWRSQAIVVQLLHWRAFKRCAQGFRFSGGGLFTLRAEEVVARQGSLTLV
jgi:hypothetical protein